MSKQLVIAEKPSQAQDISKGLSDMYVRNNGYLEGQKYVITWGYGHLIELEDPEAYDKEYKKWTLNNLPIIPKDFQYRIAKDSYQQFEVINSLIHRKDIDRIIIATDPGREGELIARLILKMSKNTKPLYRFWTSKALTPQVVKEGFSNLKEGREFDRLYQSAIARQQADWLIGINATRAMTVKHNAYPPLSIGRVQTPTLKLIVDLEASIRSFKPQDYWHLKATFQNKKGEKYEGLYIVANEGTGESENGGKDKREHRINKEAEALDVIKRVKYKNGVITSIKHEIKEEPPLLLFSLTSLQQEANKLYKYSAEQVLNIAQSLYEAKYITYPRSDSQYLNNEMVEEVKVILQKLSNNKNILFDNQKCNVSEGNKRVFDTSKLTDHHALIPTGLVHGINNLSKPERNIYELIIKRFVASFYPNYKYKSTTIITTVGQDMFITFGKTIVELGWREIYNFNGSDKEIILPNLIEKDTVENINITSEKKQTTPPSRYTDASILEAMSNASKFVEDSQLKKVLKETAGIGTAATRAGILETLIKRGYVLRAGKTLVPTQKAIQLIDVVRNESLSNIAFTAMWEQNLEEIALGDKSYDEFMKEITNYTKYIVAKIKSLDKVIDTNEDKEGIKQDNKYKEIGKCPECNHEVIEALNTFRCSNKNCIFVIWKNCFAKLGKKSISTTLIKKLLTGKEVNISGLKSKSGKTYNSLCKLIKDDRWGWRINLNF